jgi:hypothetical protein
MKRNVGFFWLRGSDRLPRSQETRRGKALSPPPSFLVSAVEKRGEGEGEKLRQNTADHFSIRKIV